MLTHRFTRRGLELLHEADKGGAAGAGGKETAPAVRGVTVAERASRSAQERDLSPENDAIVPSVMGDILPLLNTSGVKLGGQKSEDGGQKSEEESETESETVAEAEETTETDEAETTTGEEEGAAGDESAGEEEDQSTINSQLSTEGEEESEELTGADGKKFKLPPEAQAAVNRRIGEITREKHELKGQLGEKDAKIAELETRLSTVNAGPIRIAPTPENPLADVASPADLQQRIAQAQQVKLWAMENADGADVVKDAKTGETEFLDATKVREQLINAERVLNAVPQRQQYLAQKAQADQIGAQVFPEIFKAGSPENQRLQAARAAMPWLYAARGDADLIIAQALIGEKIMRERLAAKSAKPALKPAPAKVHGGPTAKPAPKAPAKVVEARKTGEAVAKSHGDAKSVLRFAENLVGV